MAFLLDTNVVSELRKASPNPCLSAWFDPIPPEDLYMSVLVVGEIRQGIERLRRHDPAQVAVLETWLDTVKRAYADRLVPISVEIADVWGRISRQGPLPLADGLMAATALVHDWTLATRNTKDVERTGVRLVNPFEPS